MADKFFNSTAVTFVDMTDTRTLDGIVAKDYDLYLVEGNYTENEMQARIEEKQQNDEFIYEYRAKNNHLSVEQCNNFLIQNMGEKSMYIYMHQHMERRVPK
jgi:hypothetical protein